MIKNILPLFLCAALHLGSHQAQGTDSNQATTLTTNNYLIQAGSKKDASGLYTGTISCADCAGIKMELTLVDSKKGKTYVLKQTYLGKPAGKNTLESRGKWFAATGNSQNPKVVIYQLIPDKAYEPLYFRRISNKAIELLDKDQNTIVPKANYILQKQR